MADDWKSGARLRTRFSVLFRGRTRLQRGKSVVQHHFQPPDDTSEEREEEEIERALRATNQGCRSVSVVGVVVLCSAFCVRC